MWTIVVGAGEGRRFGGPKQYELLEGATVLARSVELARTVSAGVVAVVPPSRIADAAGSGGADRVVAGGATRSESVRAGLAAVPLSAEIILVHDAARPLATAEIFSAVIDAVVSGADGAVPGVVLTDTVKHVREGVVVGTLDRTNLVSVQTPQGFRASILRHAHETAPDATDDAALIENAGGRVVVVPGDVANIKITGAGDLEQAERMLRERSVDR